MLLQKKQGGLPRPARSTACGSILVQQHFASAKSQSSIFLTTKFAAVVQFSDGRQGNFEDE